MEHADRTGRVFIVEDSAVDARVAWSSSSARSDGVSRRRRSRNARRRDRRHPAARTPIACARLPARSAAPASTCCAPCIRRSPEIVFVVLTNHATPQYRRACLEAGAQPFPRQEHRVRHAQGHWSPQCDCAAALMHRESTTRSTSTGSATMQAGRCMLRTKRSAIDRHDRPRAWFAAPRLGSGCAAVRDVQLQRHLLSEGLDARGHADRRLVSRADPPAQGRRRSFARATVHRALRDPVGLVQDRVADRRTATSRLSGYHMRGEIIGTDGIGADTSRLRGDRARGHRGLRAAVRPHLEALGATERALPAQSAPAAVARDRARAQRSC